MARQTTLFGDVIPPQRKKRCLESDSKTIRKAKVFRDTWKAKAPWPQLNSHNGAEV